MHNLNEFLSLFLDREHSEAVLCIALSHNGQHLASGSKDKTVKIASMETYTITHVISEHTAPVTCVLYNSTDTVLLTGNPQLPPSRVVW